MQIKTTCCISNASYPDQNKSCSLLSNPLAEPQNAVLSKSAYNQSYHNLIETHMEQVPKNCILLIYSQYSLIVVLYNCLERGPDKCLKFKTSNAWHKRLSPLVTASNKHWRSNWTNYCICSIEHSFMPQLYVPLDISMVNFSVMCGKNV